ncbi:low molecular weight protein-tyrosine-phosphatase [Azohydromonas sp.]|uniref:low molecular weight protein-tyrosine-phosphatase n=1 Tax=Azohydromonas sp. TaxID=1872666 RepID=UPI002BD924F1|nr:low molecular weight protein-tyrosine-phosphatase [Azohydromonas sp.]HMM87272.1 low molecular weight protein-tyrosine-phosphatase [Azohydromonas sp.]
MPPDDAGDKLRVLFVCMGNICRSPTAEAVLRGLATRRGLAHRLDADSAGTHGAHAGEPPDARAQAHGARRGYDLAPLRARRVQTDDFERFELVLAMDRDNLAHLRSICPPGGEARLRLLMEFARRHVVDEVPDPYYGPADGFERVLDLIEDACDGLIDHLSRTKLPT